MCKSFITLNKSVCFITIIITGCRIPVISMVTVVWSSLICCPDKFCFRVSSNPFASTTRYLLVV